MAHTANEKLTRSRRAAATHSSDMRTVVGIPPPFPTASLGTIVSIEADGGVMIRLAGAAPVAALALTQVSSDQLATAHAIGAQVLVVAIDGDITRPVIIGIVGSPTKPSRKPTTAMVDGQRVELTGQDEVVLKCGKASITLTKAGKVLITGTYLLSESKGSHRIRGASVQIN
jgi:hypothetical protein